MMLPHGTSTWREILPGAIGAGFLWELAKKAFLFFVSTYISVSNLVYGSVAAIIAFLVWAYLSALIFLFGAYLNVSYFQLKQQQKETLVEINQQDFISWKWGRTQGLPQVVEKNTPRLMDVAGKCLLY